MIKPNWNVFKAKFNDNPQSNFEWFCYLLFCREFNKSKGIFRYKNQAAIETDPIREENEIIGWQAKFYDRPLASHKTELIETLEAAKVDYPDISKLIFYTNQEWGQNRGKEPEGKQEVEKKANDLNIELEWRTASFFESTFVSIDNEIIAKHFFDSNKSFFDLINHQQDHSENILNEIQTSIAFNGHDIKIDRNNNLNKIKLSVERVLILSGGGGVGKTALVKDFYEQAKGTVPFYIFKATEFELRSIDDFFTGYHISDFFTGHKDESDKIIVIDSAEKLLDLHNTDPFKEFLSVAVKENWKIIFTTRDNYLENLNYEFFEIYKIAPLNINIQNLELTELNAIANQYHFSIPSDEKLLDLIENPFYLSEYLRFYQENERIDRTVFKEKIWNNIIKKSKPSRETCFMKMAFQRAREGQFFIKPNCESQILDNELKKDGIIGYESPEGYFITHDIYEEWALEKIIEGEFRSKTNIKTFFQNIGNSLALRRAFRKWVSEKLLLGNNEIKIFIEEVIKNEEIESFWKDEILISVLLSDYSENYFAIFKESLLADNQDQLKKLTFLLRIACKEVDDDILRQLGVRNQNLFSLKYVLTRPKGQGWKSLIKFIFNNLAGIGIRNIYFVLPIIHDWTSKFKEGETTRYSGLIALSYYQYIIENDVYFSKKDPQNSLLQTILYSSNEIKDELEKIFGEIIKNKWKNHRDPYYELCRIILIKLEGIIIAQTHPRSVLQLADLFWSFTPKKSRYDFHFRIGVEQSFGIEDDHTEYFPSSSYQTPIYWLLQSSFKETVDFILNFTNKTVKNFARSEFAKNEVEEIELFTEKGKPIKQYICCRLWCTYRGTQVAPHILESMHMALEKYLLDRGQNTDSETLQYWLLYLLQNSISASITGLVVSIILKYPEKTFNIAEILFRTKEFYHYDTNRMVLDQGQKSSILSLKESFGVIPEKEIYQNERLTACDDKHRKMTLENLFFNYQLFRSEETTEEDADKRQKILWGILDDYYSKLPSPSEETEADKIWRLFLARMDRRKMDIIPERTEEGIFFNVKPDLDPELKEYSEKSLEKSSEPMKYTSLKLWAYYKNRNEENYKQYKQYEEDPKLAIREVKEILSKLKPIERPEAYKSQHTESESFYLFNHSIPSEVCSVLIKNHFDQLSKDEADFCAKIILEAAYSSIDPSYQYQMTDGMRSAILALPILLEKFPEAKERIKEILFFSLFNYHPVDMAGTSFNAFSITAVHDLWKTSFEDAQSLLIGYLLLTPKLDALREKMRREYYKKERYENPENEVREKFLTANEKYLQKMINNQLSIDDVKDIREIDLYTLKTTFLLIPLETKDKFHKELVKQIVSTFAEKLMSDDREDKIDYSARHEFLKKLAYFILYCPKEEIQGYIKPFLDKFKRSEVIADLFVEIVSAEDYLDSYENFWEIWSLFKDKVIGIGKKGDDGWYINKIVKSFLFANTPWKESAVEWHTLKDENKIFFKEISEKLGHCSSVLYALSKLLNDIGSPYLDDGIFWISDMIKNNSNLSTAELEMNTIYYLENLVRKYVYKHREKIRKSGELRRSILVILNFLIGKGSVIGYILRENIL